MMRFVKLGDRLIDVNKLVMLNDNGNACGIFLEGGFSFSHNESADVVAKKIGWVNEKAAEAKKVSEVK